MKLRRRAVVKWTGASVCALIFAMWFGSRWAGVSVFRCRPDDAQQFALLRGTLCILLVDGDTTYLRGVPFGWSVRYGASDSAFVGWDWIPYHRFPTLHRPGVPAITNLTIALYIPIAVLALASAWLFHRDQRPVRWARKGRCVRCGYDLSDLPPGAGCPECGKATPS